MDEKPPARQVASRWTARLIGRKTGALMSTSEDYRDNRNPGKGGPDQNDDSRLAGPTNNDKTTAGAANSDAAASAEASADEAGTAEISPDLEEAYRLFGPPCDNGEDNPEKAGAEKDSAEETSPDMGGSDQDDRSWMYDPKRDGPLRSSTETSGSDQASTEEENLTEAGADNGSPDQNSTEETSLDMGGALRPFGQPSEKPEQETTSNKIFNRETLELFRQVSLSDETYWKTIIAQQPPADATLWELEQQMRRELIRLMALKEWDDDKSDIEMSTFVRYARMAHATFDLKSNKCRIDVQDVQAAFERAKKWACERLNQDIWLGECDMGRTRRFISQRVDGLSSALSQMGVVIRYDIRAQAVQIRTQTGSWLEINDHIEARLRETIAKLFSFVRRSSKNSNPRAVPADWSYAKWRQVFDAYLADHEVDGFVEWLKKLKPWDGVHRLDSWLTDCGFEFVDEFEYYELIGWASRSIMMVACLRATNPGLKHDTIPVLIGPQGVGKSTALAWLLAEEHRNQWFSDGLRLSADEKRRVEALQSAVIVEVAEMTGATTADIESLKAFLSRTTDHVRLSYRRNPEHYPRLCSIVGTANGTVVLPNDPSGNRRFVALRIKTGSAWKVRKYLEENREQLWAEAWYCAQSGEGTYFSDALRELQERANEAVRAGDNILEDSVRSWLKERMDKSDPGPYFTLAQCAQGCGILRQGESPQSTPAKQVRRLTRVLERFGCVPGRTRIDGTQKRVWFYPERIADFAGDDA